MEIGVDWFTEEVEYTVVGVVTIINLWEGVDGDWGVEVGTGWGVEVDEAIVDKVDTGKGVGVCEG